MADISDADRGVGQDDVVRRMKRALDASRRKIEVAEQGRKAEAAARGRAEAIAAEAERRRFADNEVAIDASITAHETTLQALESELHLARESGDASRETKVLRNIATAQARLDVLRGNKAQVQQMRTAGGGDKFDPASRLPANLAPGEDERLARYAPATREWIKKNPRFLDDKGFRDRAIKFHEQALNMGLEEASADYFDFIDERLAHKGGGLDRDDRDDDRDEDTDDPAEQARERRRREARDASRGSNRRGSADIEMSDVDDPLSNAARTRQPDRRYRGSDIDEPDTGTGARPSSRAADSGDDFDRELRGERGVPMSDAELEAAEFSNPDLYAKDPKAALREYAENKRILTRQQRIGPRSRN